ncbi:MAG: DinB family protein [Candidatus Solibacter usitatus]|nr:DinB family protein [Candidatus Solibacter usitatus]
MTRYLFLAAAIAAGSLQAQNSGVSKEAKQAYTAIRTNLVKMAEKMPEEHYAFKPVPEIRTFGGLVGHVADSMARTCGAVNGQMKNLGASAKTSKADLVAAMKEASAECDKAFDAMTDASALEMVKGPRGERTRLSTLTGVTTHNNEEYGYMAVYLRLKGVVPPSSEGR